MTSVQQAVELTALPADDEVEAAAQSLDQIEDRVDTKVPREAAFQPGHGRSRDARAPGEIGLPPAFPDAQRPADPAQTMRVHRTILQAAAWRPLIAGLAAAYFQLIDQRREGDRVRWHRVGRGVGQAQDGAGAVDPPAKAPAHSLG